MVARVREHFIRKRGHLVVNPDYTDLLLVVGATIREAEEDMEDLLRRFPEETLGYRIEIATPDTVLAKVQGRRIRKVIYNPRIWASPNATKAWAILNLSTLISGGSIKIFNPKVGVVVK